ncbi:MAG: hypothetical protein ABEL76_14005 [Bradymonadaceae bacterium]
MLDDFENGPAGDTDRMAARYWLCVLVVVSTTAVAAPLWLGTVPLLSDIGRAASSADLWARADDVAAFGRVVEHRSLFGPGLLSEWVVALLGPICNSLTALRIFATLAFTGFVAGLFALADAFDRSRWIVFPAIPLVWTGALAWGPIDRLALPALFAWGLVCARRTDGDNPRWSVSLAGIGVLTYLAEPTAALAVGVSTALVLAVQSSGIRDLVHLPSAATGPLLWWLWTPPSGSTDAASSALRSVLGSPKHDPNTPLQVVRDLVSLAADVTGAGVDTYLLVAAAVCWFVLLAASDRSELETDWFREGDTGETSRLKRIVERTLVGLRRRSLAVVAVSLWAMAFLAPRFLGTTNLHLVLAPLLFPALAWLPNPADDSPLVRLAAGIAVLATVGLGAHVSRQTLDQQRASLAGLEEVVDHLPTGRRVSCIDSESSDSPRTPSPESVCRTLVHTRADGWAGVDDSSTSGPVELRSDAAPPLRSLHASTDDLRRWDAVIARATSKPRAPETLKLIGSAGGAGEDSPRWYLYDVREPPDEG